MVYKNEIIQIYNEIQSKIIARIEEFNLIWKNGSDYDIFIELIFCLLTPQSKAVKCWECVQNLANKNLLLNGNVEELSSQIKGYARFHNTKAERIIKARNLLINNNEKINIKENLNKFGDDKEKREWLVKNINGYGYKEASHFLRNISFGDDIAILDRHIYKNLKILNIIDEIPKNINAKKYFEIEEKMFNFSKEIKIPMNHLDFVLWYKEAGEVFK